MVLPGRRKSIAFIIAMGAALILVLLLLYIGWVLLRWRTGSLLYLGVLLLALVIGGVVANTVFLVREIRRNEQKDAFINAVTHELKTPVASIRLYLETLQKRPVDEAKRQEFYRVMLEDCDRLLASIEQVLRTGRSGAAGRRLNLGRFELGELVAGCVERARTLHGVSEDGLSYHPDGPIPIVADLDEVRAAVSNLIDNAVKYSGSQVKIVVQTEAEGRTATVRVIDHGAGIPKDDLTRVFKRFYRVPGPLASRIKGAGLGLYIVRAVAKRHGGRVWAESEGPGQGSTFILQLPVTQ